MSIRYSQTAQLEGEAESAGSRQVRGRLCLELPRPGRGEVGDQSHLPTEGCALEPAGVQPPWLPAHEQLRWKQHHGDHHVDGCSLLHGPCSGLCLLAKSRAALGKKAAGGFGLQLNILCSVHSRGDATTCGSHGAGGHGQALPILSGAPLGQQGPGISISCPYKEGVQSNSLRLKTFLEIQIIQKSRWTTPLPGWPWRR